MKYNRRRNQKREVNGRQPETLPTAKKRRHSYQIAAAIVAVFVLHFVWQFSFIQRENLRITEDVANSMQLDVLPVESLAGEKIAEVKPDVAVKKTAVEETVKNVVPVKYSPSENNLPRLEVKKKAVREPRSERLRRAEKLLTGF